MSKFTVYLQVFRSPLFKAMISKTIATKITEAVIITTTRQTNSTTIQNNPNKTIIKTIKESLINKVHHILCNDVLVNTFCNATYNSELKAKKAGAGNKPPLPQNKLK